MKQYDVTITETLQRTVSVEAGSQIEAEQKVTDAWDHQDYVLGAEDFVGVDIQMTAERELEKKNTMDVLLVQPGAYPQSVTIETGLEALQSAVGGDIEAVYPFEDNVALVVNEEGKINGMPLNRALRTEDGDIHDIVAGDFLVVGLTEDDFGSLTPEQMEKFEKEFHQPETFIRMGKSIMAIPLPDDMVKNMSEKQPSQGMKPKQNDRESL